MELTKTKYKERTLKAAREKKQVTHKGNPIGLTAALSAETLQVRRKWQHVYLSTEREKHKTKIAVLDEMLLLSHDGCQDSRGEEFSPGSDMMRFDC